MPADPAALRELATTFLRLGLTSFGGPIAHLSAMEDDLVSRRGWLSRAEFLDLAGITAMLPGPNSTELAMAIGYRRAGPAGLVTAGLCFILPAALLVWGAAVLYGTAQREDSGGWSRALRAVLAVMQPVVLAVIVQAAWRFGRTLLRTRLALIVTLVTIGASIAGVDELLVLLLGAALAVGAHAFGRGTGPSRALLGGAGALALQLPAPGLSAPPPILALALSFLKIGGLLFGSGYVLFAFLREEFVVRHAWLTEAQLLDAIAIGQVTPGPLFTSATFVGYLLRGHAGAVAATVAIFAPAFLLVGFSGRIVGLVNARPVLRRALDGVNAASLALMIAAVGRSTAVVASSGRALLILLVAALALVLTRVPASLVLLAGALLGVISQLT